jgi:hypothetical protein
LKLAKEFPARLQQPQLQVQTINLSTSNSRKDLTASRAIIFNNCNRFNKSIDCLKWPRKCRQ